jgi:molybdate transport system substrate-binding protein
MTGRAATIALLALLLAACAQPSASGSGSAPAAELTILAASSLTDAGAELEAAYEAANAGSDLTFSFDSSSALRGQVEAGAAADV